MIRRAKEFDGVIYSIWTDTQSYEPLSPLDIQQETFDLAHDHMKELADAGGGAFYECESSKISPVHMIESWLTWELSTLCPIGPPIKFAMAHGEQFASTSIDLTQSRAASADISRSKQ